MARTGFKLPGFTSWVERVKNVTAKEAAELIVEELQEDGPAWTGEFRNNWIIVTGTGKRIPATKESSYNKLQRQTPTAEPIKKITAPKVKGRAQNNGYTIGNIMRYRDIALDLDPGGRPHSWCETEHRTRRLVYQFCTRWQDAPNLRSSHAKGSKRPHN